MNSIWSGSHLQVKGVSGGAKSFHLSSNCNHASINSLSNRSPMSTRQRKINTQANMPSPKRRELFTEQNKQRRVKSNEELNKLKLSPNTNIRPSTSTTQISSCAVFSVPHPNQSHNNFLKETSKDTLQPTPSATKLSQKKVWSSAEKKKKPVPILQRTEKTATSYLKDHQCIDNSQSKNSRRTIFYFKETSV